METFAASSAKPFDFVENRGHKLHPITYLRCQQSHSTPARDAAAAVLGSPKKHRHHAVSRHCFSSFSVSLLHRKTILPVSSTAAALCASEAQALVGDEGIQTKDTTEYKTVHVKFELRRECSFGQQFLMVGDDPMFGLWDPLNAIPLNWSEGHVWAVELDIPCDRVIKYKFILKGGDDYILWQPGPDRILQTWETKQTITVCEDWNNAELQTIMEEDPVTNLLQLNGEPERYREKELKSENGYFKPNEAMSGEKPIAAVAENITEQNGEKEVEANGFPVTEFAPSADKLATLEIMDYPNTGRSSSIELNLDSGAAVPVLVQGLTPLPTAETKEASVSKAEKDIRTDSSLNIPEPYLKEEPGIELPNPKEETENWLNDKLGLLENGQVQVQEPQLFEEKEQPNDIGREVSVLENDSHWGRRTLQQFLVNLGLMKQNL